MDREAMATRLAKASPGPWYRHGPDVYAAGFDAPILVGRDGSSETRSQSDADAEFVAHARADLDELLGALRQDRLHGRTDTAAWEYRFVTISAPDGTDSELDAAGAQGWRFVAVVSEKAGHVLLLLERSH